MFSIAFALISNSGAAAGELVDLIVEPVELQVDRVQAGLGGAVGELLVWRT